MGGHGDTMVPMPNHTKINGISLNQLIKENKIDSINLDFDQKILIIFLANRNDEHGSEKLGAKFYDYIKKNEIEVVYIIKPLCAGNDIIEKGLDKDCIDKMEITEILDIYLLKKCKELKS